MTTLISRIISVENHASTTSLLTMLHAVSTASAATMLSELDSFTLFPSSSSFDEDDLPSTKRDNLSDFNRKKSDDDSVASGNDSAAWEKEGEQMRHVILAQAQAKDADDISEDDSPVNEVEEFMMICGEGEQVVNENPLPSNVPQQEFEMIQVELIRLTGVAILKEIVTLFSLSTNAPKKEVYLNCIRDSSHVTKISDTAFEYWQVKTNVSGRVKIPTWILLTPEGTSGGWCGHGHRCTNWFLWSNQPGECCWCYMLKFPDVAG
jgi:hypothetical protein